MAGYFGTELLPIFDSLSAGEIQDLIFQLEQKLNIGKDINTPASSVSGNVLTGSMIASGAIVESGENSNGQYWRWESGLQVCVRSILFPTQEQHTEMRVTTPWPASFFGSAPRQFITIVTQTGDGSVNGIGLLTYNGIYGIPSIYSSDVSSYAYRHATNDSIGDILINILGIGFWK